MRWGAIILSVCAVVLYCIFMYNLAHGAPPPGADPALAPWFRGLEQPATGWPCCSVADCRPVVTREHEGHLEAFIAKDVFRNGLNEWVAVPESAVLHGHDNPLGEPVACFYGQEIRCFVPATGT